MRRQLKAWREQHVHTATLLLNDLAAEMIILAEAEVSRLALADKIFRQDDFISERVKTRVRDAAEPLAEALLAAANRDLAEITDIEAVRLRAADYAVRGSGPFDVLARVTTAAAAPFGVTTAMHARITRYVRSVLIAGPKGTPAVLEQLSAAYGDAAKRALRP